MAERPAPRARLSLLGIPVLETDAGPAALGLPPRAVVLLAFLALHWDRPVARGLIAATLWPNIPEQDGRANLRRYLHLISHALPPPADALRLTKATVQWNAAGLGCDIVDFLIAAQEPGRSADAASLYRGELCAGIVDEALEPLRAAFEERFEGVLRTIVAGALAHGDHATALLALQRLIERQPYDEELGRTLMRTRLESGDRAGAVRDYHALCGRLRADLGLEPEPQTRALLEGLLADDAAAATAHNLVAPNTSFLGRAIELRGVVDALERDRLVSIVGTGGIGKTRLAIEAGFLVSGRFRGGVWFVELARCETAIAAAQRIAEVVDAQHTGDPFDGLRPVLARDDVLLVLDNLEQLGDEARSLAQTLLRDSKVRLLATSRRRLGCEGERVISLGALDIPPASPTAPEALARYGAVRLFLERATKVAPNLRLTFETARSVGIIARRLDGVPLAIELVASRANLLTLDGIAKRLEDQLAFADQRRAERHVSIEAAIAWSYELLAPAERAVLHCIAVFGESWTTEAFESVCGDLVPGELVGVISELVESSLLTTEHVSDGVRYRTYETTRGFAAARLDELGTRHEFSRRHLAYYVGLAERIALELTSEKEQPAFGRCDRDRSNFALAMTWATTHDRGRAARLVAALWRYWVFRGEARFGQTIVATLESAGVFETLPARDAARFSFAAGMLARELEFASADRYLERALLLFRTCGDETAELEVLVAMAATAFTRAEYVDAEQRYRACLALQETRGDDRAAASSLANLAQLTWVRGDFEAALELLERARRGFERTENLRGIAHVFRSRALIFTSLGRHDEAVAQASEGVVLYERLGERVRVADALSALSDACSSATRYGAAFEAARRSLEILRDARSDVFLAATLNSLMLAASRVGEFEEALRVHAIGREVARRIGRGSDGLAEFDEALATARAALSPAVAQAALESGNALGIEHCIDLARSLSRRYAESPDRRAAAQSDDCRTIETVT